MSGHSTNNDLHDDWSPNVQTVFKALASARLCAAVWNNITDCDETYNYWEPLHYVLFGSGFQTWEYSPCWDVSILISISPIHIFHNWYRSGRFNPQKEMANVYRLVHYIGSHRFGGEVLVPDLPIGKALNTVHRIQILFVFGLAAAFTWTCFESCVRALKLPEKFTQYLTLALIVSSSGISVSRVIGQYRGYHAPMDVFLELNRLSWENEGDSMKYNICVGKEWHRMKLLFIASEFRGQLPRPFDPAPNGTWSISPYMNDLNKEETTRYAALKDCDYLVDLETGVTTEREPQYSQMTEWETIFQVDFLDNAGSPQLLRAFYIPWFSETYCKKIPYVLLKRKPSSNKKKRQR
ncbi:hypothetical protein DAPPUDRAFT_259349 [Daphnia pulex]|uniref:Mannosyltransferase n=1 Tax=Daphnia pulex TaxID=6669 RepID=E9HH49_DAPPU|nr:hypothetical protein DAPPUDRAFT_259349 [Daphnia pulex]|eukprot:EFX68930.1 hypothetical protein DAPPUDRAFT_259349 [Daphnia pulex]